MRLVGDAGRPNDGTGGRGASEHGSSHKCGKGIIGKDTVQKGLKWRRESTDLAEMLCSDVEGR
eukprot:5577666-Pleurochrysis_carterae.AAC.1